MGYTTVPDRREAVDAARRIVPAMRGHGDDLAGALPVLIDQVEAEAGVVDPGVAARAIRAARGDVARAVSLVRAWAATLERFATVRASVADLRVTRRITPGFSAPAGGQYLGASLDYEERLLDFGNTPPPPAATNGAATHETSLAPDRFPWAAEALAREGVLAREPAATPADVTRTKNAHGRGALLQRLARGETGAMTALAYSAIRGYGQRQDPTLVEFRSGALPVRVPHPDGGEVLVGEIPVTCAEVVLYRLHDEGRADARLTLGVGVTTGRLERRAIAAAMLDAGTTRAAGDPNGKRAPSDDAEFIAIACDGQESTGFVEHLKLPHYVTFTSDLDRVRAARSAKGER